MPYLHLKEVRVNTTQQQEQHHDRVDEFYFILNYVVEIQSDILTSRSTSRRLQNFLLPAKIHKVIKHQHNNYLKTGNSVVIIEIDWKIMFLL